MAEGKKSFIIYTDSRGIVNKLSNERAGILFKTLFSYCDDENPICDDEVVDMAFEHFKNILKRDLRKYKNIVERNRENGKTGGRPKNPVGFLKTQQNPTKPKKADNDNDTDNDNVNDINFSILTELETNQAHEFLFRLGKKEFTKADIADFWAAFILHKPDYSKDSRARQMQHFRDWLKFQKKQTRKNGNSIKQDKSAGASMLVESIRQDIERIRSQGGESEIPIPTDF